MSDPLRDLLTFRNVPTGVTGIPRLREWDAVLLVEVPELETSSLEELGIRAPLDGPAEVTGEEPVSAEAADRVSAALDADLARPYDGLAVRRDARHWAVGGRSVRAEETLDVPEDFPGDSIEVVRTPDGDVVAESGGEPLDPRYEALAAELERRGADRFESFVARADRGQGSRWHVTVDPL